MKRIQNDYCIRMFVGSDPMRPATTKVQLENGCLYATNGYVLAKINADSCIKNYQPIENYPNAEKIISEHVSIEKKTVSVDTLFNDLMKIEVCFKPKMVDCEECNGYGTCTCDHCDSDYECKDCKGNGIVPGKELELSGEYDCELFGKTYTLQFLDLIIRTAVYTDIKEIEISNAEGVKGTVFTVGDFTILLMPKYKG